MSDTPRTDQFTGVDPVTQSPLPGLVPSTFVRRLERELNAALNKIESLKQEVKDVKEACLNPYGY